MDLVTQPKLKDISGFSRGANMMSTIAASCSVATSSSESLPNVGEKPNQPKRFLFPKREYGKKTIVKRAFQQQWFYNWPWIHYDEANDVAFCHTCVTAVRAKKLKNASIMVI